MIDSDNRDDESENVICGFEHIQALEIVTRACNRFKRFVVGKKIRL